MNMSDLRYHWGNDGAFTKKIQSLLAYVFNKLTVQYKLDSSFYGHWIWCYCENFKEVIMWLNRWIWAIRQGAWMKCKYGKPLSIGCFIPRHFHSYQYFFRKKLKFSSFKFLNGFKGLLSAFNNYPLFLPWTSESISMCTIWTI